MNPTDEQVNAGQAVYSRWTLSLYDVIVLGISNRFIWKCPSRYLESHYRRHLSANHLDVGVGTGYFLDRCPSPSTAPRVALMDLNADSLAFASRRIARYRPENYLQNVLEPVQESIERFDSIGLNYLLHCLPGTIGEKAVVFDHLQPLMNPGAVLFGSTILQGGVPRGSLARGLMALYNSKGIFSNCRDDLEGLEGALSRRFEKVEIQVVGCVALFSAA
jgi:2-polyprenyl-3-methyl-5-hydroxy-6-metoxy-1,4-benzoquinol methylase